MPTKPAQSIGSLRIAPWKSQMAQEDIALQRAIEQALTHVQNQLDSRFGYRGPVLVHNDIHANGNAVTNLGAPDLAQRAAATDMSAVPRKYALPLIRQSDGTMVWDHQSTPTANAHFALTGDALPPLDQVLQLIKQLGLALTTAPPQIINVGDTSGVGIDKRAAHGDHRHGVNTALIADIHSLGIKAAGVSTKVPRADHTHDVSVIATASLPAAGAGENGLVLIENTGATINFVIYGNGQRIRLVGSGGGGVSVAKYGNTFAAVTSVSVPGATHGLGTNNILSLVWDNASPRNQFLPNNITIDDGSFDVAIDFGGLSTSGRYLLLGFP